MKNQATIGIIIISVLMISVLFYSNNVLYQGGSDQPMIQKTITLLPKGPGDWAQQIPNGNTENWDCVNDGGNGDSDYIYVERYNTDDEQNWFDNYDMQYIENVPEDATLISVKCHIKAKYLYGNSCPPDCAQVGCDVRPGSSGGQGSNCNDIFSTGTDYTWYITDNLGTISWSDLDDDELEAGPETNMLVSWDHDPYDATGEVRITAFKLVITYEIPAKVLTVNYDTDLGSYTASPEGPNYEPGTYVTLVATNNSNSIFTSWEVGGQTYTSKQITVSMSENLTAILNFQPKDNDGDGYDFVEDCNDDNPFVNPGMEEVPGNGIDDNCNGKIDEKSQDEQKDIPGFELIIVLFSIVGYLYYRRK